MTALAWKLGTLAGAVTSVFFALHPLRAGAESRPTAAGKEAAPTSQPSWVAWIGGKPAVTSSAPLIAKLRGASTAEEACAALGELGEAGDEGATQAIVGALDGAKRTQIRICATDALGHVRSGEAQSWLEELARDHDATVRAAAIRALASSEEPSAREVVVGIARAGAAQDRAVAAIALAEAKVDGATSLVIALLPTADVGTQTELLAALGTSRDPGAVTTVAAAAMDGPLSVRQAAVDALGAIGGDAAVTALASLLQSGRRDLVAGATKALAQANTPAARRALFDALDGPRRDLASDALGALASLEGPEVREAMLHALDGPDRTNAVLAGQWFGEHHDEAVVPQLASLAQHGGSEVAQAAIAALAAIGSDDARDAIVQLAGRAGPMQPFAIARLTSVNGDPAAARALCIKLAQGSGGGATAALTVLGDDTSAEAREALIDAVRTGGPAAPQAMTFLAKRGDEASIRAVADVARAGSGDARLQALEALGEAADPRATATLVATLKDGDPNVRRAALGALASVGGAEAERAIADVAATGPRDARLVATQSLVQLGADAVGPLEKLAHDADPAIARTALIGLAGGAPDRAAVVVAEVARAQDPRARLAAIQATEQLDPDDASRILLAALRDGDVSVTQTAAAGLGRLGTPEAEAALAELLTAPTASYEAQRAAADALATGGGEVATRYATVIERLRAMPAPDTVVSSDDDTY